MSELNSLFEAQRRQRFRRQLTAWYAAHQRDLPWRRLADPYAVWISEIMLQQTVVAAVIPYFERFRARFPDVHALASADESEVLQHWEGLGYYSRARNIHKAAKIVSEEL
ncbi:MAG: A/G-specific adenine glycosylase, partial [Planctomycetaceae bacterium]|nr:A/G-specific adenine glycosylase [Planctomycetaceae bacterium]